MPETEHLAMSNNACMGECSPVVAISTCLCTVLPIVNFMTSGGQTGSQLAVNQWSINGHEAVKVRTYKMADLIDFRFSK